MNSPRRAFLALGAILPLATCAGDAAPRRTTCFWPSQVSGFSDAGPDKAIVRIGNVQRWELTLDRGCPDVDWALGIGIRARSGQAICPGRPAEVVVPFPSGNGARTCLVTNVRRLSAEESAAAAGETPKRR